MKGIFVTVGAASLLVLSGSVAAELRLTDAQMDNITASGAADGQAYAYAIGRDAYAATRVDTLSQSVGVVNPQYGNFDIIESYADVWAEAVTGGIVGIGSSHGFTRGDVLSDTYSYTSVGANEPGKFAFAYSDNFSTAFSYTIPSVADSMSFGTSLMVK